MQASRCWLWQVVDRLAVESEGAEGQELSPKRIDDNHQSIVEGLRDIGATVQSLAALGKGAPDILVGYRFKNYAFEIKNPTQPLSKRKLTDAEQSWHILWRGQVEVITSLDQALRAIGAEK